MSTVLTDRRRVVPTATHADLAADLRAALDGGGGFAAGKLGLSEQALLAYPWLLRRAATPVQRAALTVQTRVHCRTQMGVFPSDPATMLQWAHQHAAATRQLDYVGLVGGRLEAGVLAEAAITGRTLSLLELEPDRSVPDDSAHCYLPVLTGRRVLIVSSIADLLVSRANRETFEAVWARTGKPWFAPAQVSALQFPYTYDAATQRRFGSSRRLLDWIVARIDAATFDVALIAATHLGIPIAAAVKQRGRAALALGGALQVLFGVAGQRWREDPHWVDTYFTPAWLDSAGPPPAATQGLADQGAYW